MRDARLLERPPLERGHHLRRPLHAGPVRKPDVGDQVALVLLRNKPQRGDREQQPGDREQAGEHEQDRRGQPDRPPHQPCVGPRDRRKHRIETAEDPSAHRFQGPIDSIGGCSLRPEQNRGERGRERQGVDRREQRRDGDREGELPKELADDAGDQAAWHEHGAEHQRHADHRPCHLLHGLERRLPRREPVLDPAFNVLNHDDRVVDHDSDRQYQAEEREVVEAEAERRHEHERADDRHGYRDQRDQRGPPVLQEQKHDQGHEQDRVAERLEHLSLRLLDEGRRVVDDLRPEPLGKPLAERRQLCPHGLGGLDRVRPGQLVNVHTHARLTVEPADLIVKLGAELDPRDVSQPHDHAGDIAGFCVGLLDDHVAELTGRDQPAHRRERNLEGLAAGGRLLADAARRHLEVLVFQRHADVAGRQADRRHLLRVEPDPHAVVPLPDEIDVADALEPEQFVADLDRGVVGKKGLVVERLSGGVFRGGEVDDHHRRRRLLQHRHPLPLDEVGQDRHRQRDADLREHLRHVEVGARGECDRQPIAAVVGALRAHGQRVFDTADLLLDRGGDRVADELRIGSGIDRRDFDRGGSDVGVLRGG